MKHILFILFGLISMTVSALDPKVGQNVTYLVRMSYPYPHKTTDYINSLKLINFDIETGIFLMKYESRIQRDMERFVRYYRPKKENLYIEKYKSIHDHGYIKDIVSFCNQNYGPQITARLGEKFCPSNNKYYPVCEIVDKSRDDETIFSKWSSKIPFGLYLWNKTFKSEYGLINISGHTSQLSDYYCFKG